MGRSTAGFHSGPLSVYLHPALFDAVELALRYSFKFAAIKKNSAVVHLMNFDF